MATELIECLATDASRLQVEALLQSALREPAFDELDALLRSWIAAHPGPVTALCESVSTVSVTGWDALDADIAALAAKGKLCSAVGIDITGHSEGDGPEFEVSLYSDRPFPFSTSNRETILAACAAYGTVWQGAFEDLVHPLRCSGLEALHVAIAAHPRRHWSGGGAMPVDYPDYFIGVWFLYLRVSEALAAAIDENLLPYAMPILVSEHDFGPWFETVYMVDPVVADSLALPDDAAADWNEPAVPKPVVPAFETPDVVVTGADAAIVQTNPAISTPETASSRGWPWRKSKARGTDIGGDAIEPSAAQRRRGPGSFASG